MGIPLNSIEFQGDFYSVVNRNAAAGRLFFLSQTFELFASSVASHSFTEGNSIEHDTKPQHLCAFVFKQDFICLCTDGSCVFFAG